VRGALKLEIAGIEVGSCTPVPRNGGGGLKRAARTPPGLKGTWPCWLVCLLACSPFRFFEEKKRKKESLGHVIVSFVGILGPTGSHRRANGSFWIPFLTKGDARQDGKQANKAKK